MVVSVVLGQSHILAVNTMVSFIQLLPIMAKNAVWWLNPQTQFPRVARPETNTASSRALFSGRPGVMHVFYSV